MLKKSLFTKRQVINTDDIRAWARNQKIPSMLMPGDLHVTICYSKESIVWPKSENNVLKIPNVQTKIAYFGEEKNVLVLKFSSNFLTNSWKKFRNIGASWDFPDYIPHITISYKPDTTLKLKPYVGNIILGPEIFDEILTEFNGVTDLKEIKP